MKTQDLGDKHLLIEDFKPVAESFAREIRRQGFDVIVVNGLSGQTGGHMVKEAWKRIYPNVAMPKFLAMGMIGKSVSKRFVERGAGWQPHNTGSIDEEIQKKKLESLMKKVSKKSKVLVFDEIAHTGNQLYNTKWLLGEMGFGRVTSGALYEADYGKWNKWKVDLVASKGTVIFTELHAKRRTSLAWTIGRRGVIEKFRRLTKKEHAEVRGRGNDMKEFRRRGK